MPTATERIREVIETTASEKPKVALDTCCVQYYISNPPVQPWADCLDPIFRAAVDGQIDLYVSTVVVSELLSHVHLHTGTMRVMTGTGPSDHHEQAFSDTGCERCGGCPRGRLRGNYILARRLPGTHLTL